MGKMSKDEINVGLFDEVKRLKEENERLKINIGHALQYTHDEVLNGNLSVKVSEFIYDLLTNK